MKKLALWFVIAMLLYAEEKSTLVADDVSVAKSSRTTLFALNRLATQTHHYKIPVKFCNLEGKCIYLGNWDVDVSQNFLDNALFEHQDLVVSNKYDRVVAKSGELAIKTAQSTATVPATNLYMEFHEGSFGAFSEQFETYLNTQIAPLLKELLLKSAEAKYDESKAKDVALFIETKAKELGLPLEVLLQIQSTGYAFGFYLPRIEGELAISQVQNLITKAVTFETSLSAPVETKMVVYAFDKEKFVHYKTFKSDAKNPFDAIAKTISGSQSYSSIILPISTQANRIFEHIVTLSLKDSLIALGTRLKNDDNFKTKAKINYFDAGEAVATIGTMEDVRHDHPFMVKRVEDGVMREVGFVKSTKVGNTCKGATSDSRFRLMGGVAEEADLLVEHPWSGTFGKVELFTNTANDSYSNATGSTGLSIGFKGDVGYILDDAELSEVWLDADVGIGSLLGVGGVSALIGSVGVEKRYYLLNGLYYGMGGDISYEGRVYNYGSNYLALSSAILAPKAVMGFVASPKLEFYAKASAQVPLINTTSLVDKEGKDVSSLLGSKSYARSTSFALLVGMSFHTDFAGIFAPIYATQPSNRCD